MNYKILEARIEYNQQKIKSVTVLVEISEGDIRAIYADNKNRGGYMFITSKAVLSDHLLQMVAATGMELLFSEADKVFPEWRIKYK